MKRFFLPLGFISGIPFIIPLSNYIYVGIILFNLRFFSWWVIVLLAFWAYVTVMGSDGARAMLKEELDKTSPGTANTEYNVSGFSLGPATFA